MKIKTVLISALLLGVGVFCGLIAAESRPSSEATSTGVIHINAATVASALEKGGVLLVTNNFKIQAGHRVAPGESEVHERDTDIFFVTEGSASFVIGGKALEPRTTAPGEIRGKGIEGGTVQRLVKGDVIVIPNGVPHWFKEVEGPFVYFVVKVSK